MDAPDATHLDGPAVRTASDEIDRLADDLDSYGDLNEIQPKSGDFAVGHWLDELIEQRRDALQQHCIELQSTLRATADKLRHLATDIEHVDRDNSAQVAKLNGEIESTMDQVRARLTAAGAPPQQQS